MVILTMHAFKGLMGLDVVLLLLRGVGVEVQVMGRVRI